jgi:hypothetical protein
MNRQQRPLVKDITTRFKSALGPLDNPLKGWCVYTDAGTIYQPYSMVFRYVPWSKLEPREGEYRFAEWEAETWEVPGAKGKHIILRVYADYPRRPGGLPEWLRAKGVTEKDYTDYGGGKSPDYNHPALVTGLEKLIAALGARYDKNPRVAFLQLGLLGYWGEWHTYPNEKWFASLDTQRRVIDAYHAAFPNKKLMARYAQDYTGKQPWLGFHDDYFPEDTGDEKDWHFLGKIKRAGRAENWQSAVIGGEMIPAKGENAHKWLAPEHFDFTMDRLRQGHFSWVGPYSPALEKPPTAEWSARCEKMVRAMGYEFALQSLRHPETIRRGVPFTTLLIGANQGIAPFYYQWPVEMALLAPEGRVVEKLPLTGCDIRQWHPGPFAHTEQMRIRTAPPGRYTLALGIIDPLTNKPAIGFANALPKRDGWTALTTIEVAR